MNVHATVNPEKAKPEDQVVDLTWELPADSAMPKDVVVEYTLEMKPVDSSRWQEVPLKKGPLTQMKTSLPTDGMKEFVDYEFRVTAANKAGKSKPSEPSNPVQLGRQTLKCLLNLTLCTQHECLRRLCDPVVCRWKLG